MLEKRPSDYRDQWDALKRKAVVLEAATTQGLPADDPKVQAQEAAIAALNAEKDAVAHGAWLATARDLADLALLAEVVFDQFWDIAAFPQLPADIEDCDQQQVAVAYLVREVLAVSQTVAREERFMTAHTHQNGPARTADRTAGEKALADWREAMAREIAALEASDAATGDADLQQAYKAAVEHSRQVAGQAWTRLGEPADVRVRAEIARHCLWPRYHGERRFEAVLGGKEYGDGLELAEFDERAVAELVKAVLWTAPRAAERARPGPATGRDWLAPGGRPRMPQLSDKDLDDLYAFAGGVEADAQCLREKLSSVFHEYRMAAFDWDHARGLLSPEKAFDGVDPETERRQEQARARTRRQMAPADEDADPAGPLLPGLEEMLCKARQGVTALRTVMKGWEREHGPGRPFCKGEDAFLASFDFCADGLEATLNMISERIDHAIEGQSPPG